MSTSSKGYLLGIFAVLFASIVWGTTGTAATFAPEVSAVAIGAAAMGIGGLLQAMRAGRSIGRSIPQLLGFPALVMIGAVSVAIYPLAFYGSMRLAGVTVGTVVTIGSAPLLSALIEFLFDRTPLTRRWIAGALVGLAGIVLLAFAENPSPHAITVDGNTLVAGILCGLIGGMTYALYSWCARSLMMRGIPTSAAMGTTFGLGGLLLMPILIATGAPFLASWTNAAVGAYMAIVPMFMGYIAFGFALARISASTAITITLIEPVVAAVLAVFIVGERLPPAGWLGVVLVISCLLLITLPVRILQRRPRRRPQLDEVNRNSQLSTAPIAEAMPVVPQGNGGVRPVFGATSQENRQ